MWLLLVLVLLSFQGLNGSTNRFTNILCESQDESLLIFTTCELKVLGRGIVGANVYMKLLQQSVNNVLINLSLWRKFNGFRPFMYNKTLDFCKFMAKNSEKLSIEKFFFDAVARYSNVNHSCPYDHDVIVKEMIFQEEFLKFLPLPSAEYKIEILGSTDHRWRFKLIIHFLRKEDLLLSK